MTYYKRPGNKNKSTSLRRRVFHVNSFDVVFDATERLIKMVKKVFVKNK
jgi:hypothetical protein